MNVLLVSLLCIAGALAAPFEDGYKTYEGHEVLRLTPKTWQSLLWLHETAQESTEGNLDFWTHPSAINNTVDVMVPPHLKDVFAAQLKGKDITVSTMIPDVSRLIKEQRFEVADVPSGFTKEAFPRFWTTYRRLADFFTLMSNLAANSFVSVENIGKSYENRDLRMLKISTGSNRPIIFIDSLIHSREWITGATTMYFAQYLVDGWNNNVAAVRNILNAYDFYILPVLNPDGYEFTHTSTRLWRKTRTPNSGSTCIGTDANRNFGFAWMSAGASNNPCSDTYGGSAAASQTNVKAIQDYLVANRARVRQYVSVHSYSQLLLWSWGNNSTLTPEHSQLQSRGQAAVNALTAHYNTRYTIGTITNVLYAASGNSVDYARAVAGITSSYTIELRDTGSYGFQLPASQIVPSGVETTSFFMSLANGV